MCKVGFLDDELLSLYLSLITADQAQRGERRDVDDALADYVENHWETWGELSNGGIKVTCPWHDDHSGGSKGDSSSSYFPAGTNGYSEGAYVCLHTSCETRGRGEFASAIGYTENLLADLALPVPHKDYSELNDPVIQRERFVQQAALSAKGDVEAMRLDEDFLKALEHAMPPAGGMGMGMDRLLMAITGLGIRETILFPLVK